MLSGGALIMLLGIILMLAPPLRAHLLRQGLRPWSPTFETGLIVFAVGLVGVAMGAVGAAAEGAAATLAWLLS